MKNYRNIRENYSAGSTHEHMEFLWDLMHDLHENSYYNFAKYDFINEDWHKFLEFIAQNNLFYKDVDEIVALYKIAKE